MWPLEPFAKRKRKDGQDRDPRKPLAGSALALHPPNCP